MQLNAEKLQALCYKYPIVNMKLTGYNIPHGIEIPGPKSVGDMGINMRDDTAFRVNITRMVTMCTFKN